MSILAYIYRNGLWISVPLFILSAALLAYFILNVIRVVKQAHLRSVPLLEQQEIEFSEEGRDRFLGEDEVSMRGPVPKPERDAMVEWIRQCPQPWNKKCRCKARLAYFQGWLD